MRRLWIGAAIVGALAAACAGVAQEGATSGGGGPEAADGVAAPEAIAEGVDEAAVGGGPSLPGVGPRIVKNAEIEVEVESDGFQAALQDLTALAEAEGGFVLSSSVEGEEARRGTVVLRVPSERFEAALASVRDLGAVQGERISGEDVSQEFVDLEARLRNLTAQEAVLLRLMDRARTVSDTIKVQRELTGIQLEVEQIRGRLRFLEDRTSLATIRASVAETGAVATEPGIIQRGWERAVDGFLGVIGGLIAALGVLLPLGALALAAWLVVRRVRPAARRA
jgi:hypothetical protein